ncbi:MAG: hypothetical protein MJY95_01380 [Bacteroidaceae bacterium]|nr:hypothetical protein [Bacteroidaceae bacterium]
MNPSEDLKVVLMANPTMYYDLEQVRCVRLLENMALSGNYSVIYLDVPALLGMVYDDYIKGENNVSLDDLHQFPEYDKRWYMERDKIFRFMECLKWINTKLSKKISIRGISYEFTELLFPIGDKYSKQKELVDRFLTIQFEHDRRTHHADYVEFNEYLEKNEAQLKKDIGDSYDIYKRIVERRLANENKTYDKMSDYDYHKFEDFMYSYSKQDADEKAIVYLGPIQMRKEAGVTSFRLLFENEFSTNQYVVYNILDDPDHSQIQNLEYEQWKSTTGGGTPQ